MTRLAELRRVAADRRAAADAARAEAGADLERIEPPAMRAQRLAREADAAELELGRARNAAWRRFLWLAVRLAALAALLWAAWRIGYETGLVAAIGRACT